jgi:hypothetical protein
MDALLQIAKAGASHWRFEEAEAVDLAWALAFTQHWTPRLADLEASLVQVWYLSIKTVSWIGLDEGLV